MKEVDITDEKGRRYRMRLPDDAPDSDASLGVPMGPPDVVDVLGLPEPFATRLHNELHARALWNQRELKRRPQALQGALQASLRIDAQALVAAFVAYENPSEEQVA